MGSVCVLWKGQGGRGVQPAGHGSSAGVGQALQNSVPNGRPVVAQPSADPLLLSVCCV